MPVAGSGCVVAGAGTGAGAGLGLEKSSRTSVVGES
jgi:hypothetical protein